MGVEERFQPVLPISPPIRLSDVPVRALCVVRPPGTRLARVAPDAAILPSDVRHPSAVVTIGAPVPEDAAYPVAPPPPP